MDDQQLVASVLQGDKHAFQPLVAKYSSLVYSTALKIVGNPSTAEDVSQEAFWQAYRSLAGFRSQSSFSTWLVRITVNKSLDYCRQVENRTTLVQEGQQACGKAFPQTEAGGMIGPEEAVLQREEQAELMHRLSKLPRPYRKVIFQHCFKGRSCKEIARDENTSVKTIESRIYRARKMLKKNHAGGDTDALPVTSPAQLGGVYKWSGKG